MAVFISDARLEEHRAFHRDRMSRMDDPGEGRKFLYFHSRFMTKVRFDAANIGRGDPAVNWPKWTEIPTDLRVGDLPAMPGWWDDMDDCENDDMDDAGASGQWVRATPYTNGTQEYYADTKNFVDEDDLGRQLETRLHPWLHATAGWIYNDRNLRTMACSPKSERFYAIHGMFTSWWIRFRQITSPPRQMCIIWDNLIERISSDIETAKTDYEKLSKTVVDAEIRVLQQELADAQAGLKRCQLRINDNASQVFVQPHPHRDLTDAGHGHK